MEKMKYIKYGEYNSIVIFPQIINHDEFKYLQPKSAGFCYVHQDKVQCFGRSVSLNLQSEEEDTILATKQYCGIDAMLKLLHTIDE